MLNCSTCMSEIHYSCTCTYVCIRKGLVYIHISIYNVAMATCNKYMIAPVVPLPSCPVVRAQRAWGGKERLSAEERSDSGGREQAEVAPTRQPTSLSSDSEDGDHGGVETRQQEGQTTVLHTAARLDDPWTSSNTQGV